MVRPVSAPGVLLRPSRVEEAPAATDADLVQHALAGFEPAFRQLIQRYQRPVISLINRLIRDPSRAEELAQDVFVKAFDRLDTFDVSRKFATWLLAIAHHAAVDEVRRGTVRTEPLQVSGPHSEIPDARADTPAGAIERVELAKALETAIGRLRIEYRELVVLRYQQELTYDEIAEITGMTSGTIKSYLHRARKELAAHLGAAGWGIRQ